MQIRIDTDTGGFVRADSKAARRFVGPLLGPAATATLAVSVELAERYGGFIDLEPDELAARVGITEKGLNRAIGRLENFGVAQRVRGDSALEVRQWIDVPTSSWREHHYPEELANEFKLFVESARAAHQGRELAGDTNMGHRVDGEPVSVDL